MPYDALIAVIPTLPIVGFVFTALFGRRLQARLPECRERPADPGGRGQLGGGDDCRGGSAGQNRPVRRARAFDRLCGSGSRPATSQVDAGFYVDNLTACLLIVVTTIGMLVHIYSIGYMSHDPGYWRFFAYLNLFMFSMLLLVLADSWLVVFVAWELVGLSSYLLIGFWYRKRTAALAAKKAFIVNRVGDVGFALGIMLIFVSLGTLDIREVIERIGGSTADDRGRRPAHLRRGDGQERPVPAPRLAARRDGGPDPGVGAHPRRDDGQRRGLPGGPGQPDLRPRPGGDGGGRRDRHLHRDPGGLDRVDPDRHQAGPGLLDPVPARLHVRRARRRGVDRGDLPPDDPRLLQGPPVPRLGLGHPRRPRGAGHAPDGRPVAEDPDHLRDDAHRLAGDRRDPAAGRLLQQGRDPGRGVQERLHRGLGDRLRRRRDDRVLHVPADRA